MFNAVLLTQSDGKTHAAVAALDDDALPADGDVLVAIDYSTVNYKDGLAITGKAPVVRSWPMVAGIDGAGTVLASKHAAWRPGERVVLNGYGVGETHWGCLAQKARLRGDWLVKLPERFSSRDAMIIGTAGYTAMLSVMALERSGVVPHHGDVLVTGASGGVGSVAVALLSSLGYRVVASTGKLHEAEYLQALGAAEVIDRRLLSEPGKPLQKERWAAVVDSVGSHTLVNAIAQLRYGGVATACGLAQGMDFPANMAPFILRGVTLHGIDSVMAPRELREEAWRRLAHDLEPQKLGGMSHDVGLADAIAVAQRIVRGEIHGRVVVDVNR
ncbi:NADPH:quinone dehydrogenase [Pandoraea pnomenusa]|uniref:Quinone oxidoreductase YhdH n=1 Tax=Pandoraea pnomenusa TaxID=93220 RepID=A0A378YB17_9BURK|nr:MDR family oxidoreductase [Pandoraea pnomenusa]AIU25414.1 NADPH:quinone dehydrogenase [Pandoraea pnomenusa]SUA74425.1 Putative quinone oxidoreductase YhdH [Pandoraea pnomenusa]